MRRKIARTLICILLLVTAAQLSVKHYIQHKYPYIQMQRITWYMDGIVIKHVQWNKGVVLDTVYLEGNPWQILLQGPSYITIKKATIDTGSLDLDVKMPLPDTPVAFKNVVLRVPYQGQDYIFKGHYAAIDAMHDKFTFDSARDDLQLQFTVEATRKDGALVALDLSAEDFAFDWPGMQLRRGSGWLSFQLQNDHWVTSGEIEAGLFTYANRVFLKPTYSLQKDSSIFTATDKETSKKVEIEMRSLRATELQTRLLAWSRAAATQSE